MKTVVILIGSGAGRGRQWAEALRLAAGVAVTRRVELFVCLKGEAVETLSDGIVPGWAEDATAQHLPLILEYASGLAAIEESEDATTRPLKAGVRRLTLIDLAQRCAAADVVMQF